MSVNTDTQTLDAKIPAGQKLFLDNSCNSCHSMKGQGIEKKKSDFVSEVMSQVSQAS